MSSIYILLLWLFLFSVIMYVWCHGENINTQLIAWPLQTFENLCRSSLGFCLWVFEDWRPDTKIENKDFLKKIFCINLLQQWKLKSLLAATDLSNPLRGSSSTIPLVNTTKPQWPLAEGTSLMQEKLVPCPAFHPSPVMSGLSKKSSLCLVPFLPFFSLVFSC